MNAWKPASLRSYPRHPSSLSISMVGLAKKPATDAFALTYASRVSMSACTCSSAPEVLHAGDEQQRAIPEETGLDYNSYGQTVSIPQVSLHTHRAHLRAEDMDTARSRLVPARRRPARAVLARAKLAHTKLDRAFPRAPPRATSRAHRATDNPRSGDRGTSSNGSRERLPRRRRRASERERRTLPARMATARCARAPGG